jgi:hypothetical protein
MAGQDGVEGAAWVLGFQMFGEGDEAGALPILRAEVDRGNAVACVTLAGVLVVACRSEGALAMLRRGRAAPICHGQAAAAWTGIAANLRAYGGRQSALAIAAAESRWRLHGLWSFDDPFSGRLPGDRTKEVGSWMDGTLTLPAKVEVARALWLRRVAKLK